MINKNSKKRLFEVMTRLDKSFKIRLNENFDETPPAETSPEMGDETSEFDQEPEVEEKSVEEKYEELKAKVAELYALINGDEESDEEGDDVSTEPEVSDTETMGNLTEWNFDKKKGKFEKGEKKETKSHEEGETEEEEKKEHKFKKELDENKPKIPVNPIAKVGKGK